MRLKTSIFFYVCLAALIPGAVLGLVATTYSERIYKERVEQEINAGLDSMVAGIERRLLIERDILSGLSNISAVRDLQPLLASKDRFEKSDYRQLSYATEEINEFLERFQGVRTSLGTVRVLDRNGHSIVKVEGGKRSLLSAASAERIETVEEGRDLRAELRELRSAEPGSLLLPYNGSVNAPGHLLGIYNVATAIEYKGDRVGYLTINPPLRSFDQILSVAPRLQQSQLLIAEINIVNSARNGLILYDDANKVSLADSHEHRLNLAEKYPDLFKESFHNTNGQVDGGGDGKHIFYRTFLPYPDRLVSWVVAFEVDDNEIRGPFKSIHLGILSSVLIALLLSFLLAQYGAQFIAMPVRRLADNLLAYAAGDRESRITPEGPQEIKIAANAFNDMADTIASAESERDEALQAIYRSAKLASLGQMAAGIGHEISNPLNTILSTTALMQRELPDGNDRLSRDLQSVREETQRAARTVKAILNFSSQIGGELSHFDVSTWVHDTVAMAELDADIADATVQITSLQDCELEGDRNLLQQALRNLVVNALQVTPAGQAVGISASCHDGYLTLMVQDHGPGVESDKLDKVFDPFFTTKPEGKGSGLGLSISLGVVQYHGGTLELGNNPDGGALATLVLPLQSVRS